MQFVGNRNKKKIYYMLVFSLAGGPVSWMSKWHSVVVYSSRQSICQLHMYVKTVGLKRLLFEFWSQARESGYSLWQLEQVAFGQKPCVSYLDKTYQYHFVLDLEKDGKISEDSNKERRRFLGEACREKFIQFKIYLRTWRSVSLDSMLVWTFFFSCWIN